MCRRSFCSGDLGLFKIRFGKQARVSCLPGYSRFSSFSFFLYMAGFFGMCVLN